MKQKLINFYGGPGSGKSTTAAKVYSYYKELNKNVELVTEYAKDIVWQGSHNVLNNQIYIFGKQQHRLWRLTNKVEFIITDAPLLNSIVYNSEYSKPLRELILEEYNKYDNIDVFLTRVKPYNPNGRHQTEEQAKEIDNITKAVLSDYSQTDFIIVEGSPNSFEYLISEINERL